MTDNEWYYFDDEDSCVKLTDKAPEEARKSYEEFMSKMREYRNNFLNGAIVDMKINITDSQIESLKKIIPSIDSMIANEDLSIVLSSIRNYIVLNCFDENGEIEKDGMIYEDLYDEIRQQNLKTVRKL